MLRKITIIVLTLLVLTLSSQNLLAQQSYDNTRHERLLVKKRSLNPITKLQRLFKNAELYEHLLGHPHFVKLQDMAQRVWEKQTGNKRRVMTWSRRNIIQQSGLPVRTPHR